MTKILVGVVVFNESGKIDHLLNKFKVLKLNYPFKVIFVDDGSTDDSPAVIKKTIVDSRLNAEIISNKGNQGIGFSIRKVIQYGLDHKYDICVIMAGNGKDTPLEIPLLMSPLLSEGYDYIQGSRFLKGGSFDNLPFLRKCMVRGFTLLMSVFTGFRCTDVTNGFRAYKLHIFTDKRININQAWLNRYELETYLHYKVITLGYKITEVAVSKNYLPGVKNYSKIRPVIDWWKLARPIFLLKLGLKN